MKLLVEFADGQQIRKTAPLQVHFEHDSELFQRRHRMYQGAIRVSSKSHLSTKTRFSDFIYNLICD